jgi:hypothetical protein
MVAVKMAHDNKSLGAALHSVCVLDKKIFQHDNYDDHVNRQTHKKTNNLSHAISDPRVLIKKQSKNLEFQSTTENGLNLQSLYMCMAREGRGLGSIPVHCPE